MGSALSYCEKNREEYKMDDKGGEKARDVVRSGQNQPTGWCVGWRQSVSPNSHLFILWESVCACLCVYVCVCA